MQQVKPYQNSDFEELVSLYKNQSSYGGHFDPERDTPERLELTAKAGNLYVLRNEAELLGSFMILDNPHSFWLLRFAVKPGLASSGEATRKLFDSAAQIAKERGHQSVIVYTDNDDGALNQRYIDLGCQKAGAYRCYWKEVEA